MSDPEPSQELQVKRSKLEKYRHIYKEVETEIYRQAQGSKIKDLVELQKKYKNVYNLKTSRVDWRTKTGIILWFCDHYNIISKDISFTDGKCMGKEVSGSFFNFPCNDCKMFSHFIAEKNVAVLKEANADVRISTDSSDIDFEVEDGIVWTV